MEAGIPENYVQSGMSIGDGGLTMRFSSPDESGEYITVTEDDLYTYKKIVKVLKGKEVKYQRKCMSDGFYTKFVSGCWYIDNNTELSEDDSNDIVSSYDKFEEAKQYLSDKECSMNSWEFIEGKHFIVFSY